MTIISLKQIEQHIPSTPYLTPLKTISISRKPSFLLPDLETASSCGTECKNLRRGILDFLDHRLRNKNKVSVK